MPDPNILEFPGAVFVLPCKCGNTSIKVAMARQCGVSDALDGIHGKDRFRSVGGVYVDRRRALQRKHEGWPVIGVVRNPYSRLVSCWADKCRPDGSAMINGLHQQGFRAGMSFEAFVDLACRLAGPRANQHFRPLVCDLFLDEEPLWTHLLRCETLDRDWQGLAEVFGHDSMEPLPWARESKHGNPAHYFDHDLMMRVIREPCGLVPEVNLFAADFREFGYSMRLEDIR